MTAIYKLGEQPKRFASLRLSDASRQLMLSVLPGRCPPPNIGLLEARAYFKDRAAPPLGDCPRMDEGLVLSQRAADMLRPALGEQVQLIPIKIIGGAVEKPSGIWYELSLEESPSIPGISEQYFLVHPISTFTLGAKMPIEAPPLPDDHCGEGVDVAEFAQWINGLVSAASAAAANISEYFRGKPVPPLLVFGPGSLVYFSEEFLGLMRRGKLKGFTFERITEVEDGIEKQEG